MISLIKLKRQKGNVPQTYEGNIVGKFKTPCDT